MPKSGWLLRNLRLISVAVAGVIIALAVAIGHDKPAKEVSTKEMAAKSTCQPYRVDKTVRIGSRQLMVEVADTVNERAQGLGGRKCITDNEGMLFVFENAGHYQFWMKDMKFPLDILWISTEHKVVAREINVSPSTYPDRFINKDKLAQYVLEIKANRSNKLGIQLDSTIDF